MQRYKIYLLKAKKWLLFSVLAQGHPTPHRTKSADYQTFKRKIILRTTTDFGVFLGCSRLYFTKNFVPLSIYTPDANRTLMLSPAARRDVANTVPCSERSVTSSAFLASTVKTPPA